MAQLRLALRIVLLISATSSGMTIEVGGEEVAREDLGDLVHLDDFEAEDDDDDFDVRIPAYQAQLTPSLIAWDVPDRFALERTDEGVYFVQLNAADVSVTRKLALIR